MDFTKGLMLTCGATGAVLAAASVVGLSYNMDGLNSSDDGSTVAQLVTLAPVPVDLGARGQVMVSLHLTALGRQEAAVLCGNVDGVEAAARRFILQEVTALGADRRIPSDLDRRLRGRLEGIVGGHLIERLEITVAPSGATTPDPTCVR
jgi:hypothetical protein